MATVSFDTSDGIAERHTAVPEVSAVLAWMNQSTSFTEKRQVLLYVLNADNVSMSLVDRNAETLSEARVTSIDAKSAEKFGATVPVAWDVLDHADTGADMVALFADPIDEPLLRPILELGLGIPVVLIGSYDLAIARGVAAARTVSVDEPAEAPGTVAPVSAAPAIAPPEPVVAPAVASDWMHSRRNLVLAAVLLVGVLSGGVALAVTLPGNSTPQPAASVSEPVVKAAATAPNVVPSPAAAPAASALPAAPGPPAAVARPVVRAPSAAARPPAVSPVAPVPFADTAPAAATGPTAAPVPTTIDPPAFAIPPIVPDPSDPSKSQAELQQEAWDRHWQHTEEWIGQELGLGG